MKNIITLLILFITLSINSQETLNKAYQRNFEKLNKTKLNEYLIEKGFLFFDSFDDSIKDIDLNVYIYYNSNTKETLKLFYCTSFKNCYNFASGLFNDTSYLDKQVVYSVEHEYTSYKENNKYYSFLFKDDIK